MLATFVFEPRNSHGVAASFFLKSINDGKDRATQQAVPSSFIKPFVLCPCLSHSTFAACCAGFLGQVPVDLILAVMASISEKKQELYFDAQAHISTQPPSPR